MSKAKSESNCDSERSPTEQVESYDAAVLGGGPAGSAAALSLSRQGLSVALLERSTYDQDRIGETLPPAVKAILTSLGVWDEFLCHNKQSAPVVCSAWGSTKLQAQDHIFNPYGSGWHIDRKQFDAVLAGCAEKAGAKLYTAAKLKSYADDNAGNWQLELELPERRVCLRTRFLLDATGRSSTLARRKHVRRIRFDRLIAVIRFLTPAQTNVSADSFALIEAVEEGWWYSAVLPDTRLVIAFMTDADLYARKRGAEENFWKRQLERTTHTQLRTKSYESSGGYRAVAAYSSRLTEVIHQNWIAIGDAAMTFDPLAGQGVYRALQSGISGAQAVHNHLCGNRFALEAYAAGVNKVFNDYLMLRNDYYSKEQRWSATDFWRRRRGREINGKLPPPMFS
jgi:flavin-dependent dehydrogenase